jgi:hypothetical protein
VPARSLRNEHGLHRRTSHPTIPAVDPRTARSTLPGHRAVSSTVPGRCDVGPLLWLDRPVTHAVHPADKPETGWQGSIIARRSGTRIGVRCLTRPPASAQSRWYAQQVAKAVLPGAHPRPRQPAGRARRRVPGCLGARRLLRGRVPVLRDALAGLPRRDGVQAGWTPPRRSRGERCG